MVPCSDVERGGLDGFIDPSFCGFLPGFVNEACGCAAESTGPVMNSIGPASSQPTSSWPTSLGPTSSQPTTEYPNLTQLGQSMGGMSNAISSVSLSGDGNRLASLVRDETDGYKYFEVIVREYNGRRWSYVGESIPLGNMTKEVWGSGSLQDVALSTKGDRLAVGTPAHIGDTVRVFQFSDQQQKWKQVGQDMYLGEDPDTAFISSMSMSSDGGTVAIGRKENKSGKEGTVYVFEFNGVRNEWASIETINSAGSSTYSNGLAVSVSRGGERIAVGDPSYVDPERTIRVFSRRENTWTQTGQSLVAAQSFFAKSPLMISGDGNFLVTGSIKSNQVHVYQFDAQGNKWTPRGEPIVTDNWPSSNYYGSTVEISSDGGIVAIHDGYGIVQLFQFEKSRWQEFGKVSQVSAFSVNVQNASRLAVVKDTLGYHSNGIYMVLDFRSEVAEGTNDPFRGIDGGILSKWSNDEVSGLFLEVENSLDSVWDPFFNVTIQEWNDGTPDALALTTLRVEADSCAPALGKIKVCNRNYGDTRWRGINSNLVSNGLIIAAVARMNDYYLGGATDDQRRYTLCHEIGHS